MKKIMILAFLLFVFIINKEQCNAVQKKEVTCVTHDSTKCITGGITFINFIKESESAFTEIGDLPSLPSGYSDRTYYYIPNTNNPSSGIGIINGHMYYHQSNTSAPIYCFKDNNSSEYTNYIDWKNALIQLGITPPEL